MSVLLVGCGGDRAPSSSQRTLSQTTPATAPSTRPAASTDVATTSLPVVDQSAVLAYFLLHEQPYAVGRAIATADASAAVAALLSGPTNAENAAGLVTLIPAGTKLLGVKTSATETVVDLSHEFGSGGGSLSVAGRAAQMVFTITQFPGVGSVRFSLDGKPITELAGEGYAVDGLSCASFADMTPVILLERPSSGEKVTQPIRIAGRSNTFEATVYYEVLGADGHKLINGFVMATSGTGTWGTFDAVLSPLPTGTTGVITVRVFDRSSQDGAPVAVTEVRVLL